MKRQDLLLLTFLLTQTTPVWAMDPNESIDGPDTRYTRTVSSSSSPLDERQNPLNNAQWSAQWIQKAIQHVIRITEEAAAKYKDCQKVIVIGPSGSGKSTLINLLAGKELIAANGKLDTNDPLPGSAIGHERTSKTIFPSPWKGPNDTVFWDCPGFGDTGGPEQDIVNAYAIRQLFTGDVKILLTATETLLTEKASEFLKLINDITKVLPFDKSKEPHNQLKDSLSLVITKQGRVLDLDAHKELKGLNEIKPETAVFLMNSDVSALLLHLTDEKSISIRVPYFPYPTRSVKYNSEITDKILESIACLKSIKNPKVQIQLPAKSIILLQDLAHNLNKDIEGTLKNNIGPKVVQLCKSQIDDHHNSDSVEKLEANLATVKAAYNLLLETDGDFATPLDRFFDTNEPNIIREYVKTLTFLKTLKEDIGDAKENWTLALQSTIDQIHTLIAEKFESLGSFITVHLFNTTTTNNVYEKVKTFCLNILESKVTEGSDISAEEIKIQQLETGLNHINIALETLHNDSAENMMNFVDPFNMFFEDPEPKPLLNPMKTLMVFKSLKDGRHYPKEDWSKAVQRSIVHMEDSIKSQRSIMTVKQENKRLEQERLRQEEEARARAAIEEAARLERAEAARLAAEQHQAHLAEINRLAEVARQEREAAERQRVADLEAHRIAREEDARRAEEQRQIQVAEMARQAEALRLQQEETARISAAAAERQRLTEIEAARLAAAVEAAGRQRVADLEAQRLAREEADRRAVEERQTLLTALETAEQKRQEQAEAERREHFAEITRQQQEKARLADQFRDYRDGIRIRGEAEAERRRPQELAIQQQATQLAAQQQQIQQLAQQLAAQELAERNRLAAIEAERVRAATAQRLAAQKPKTPKRERITPVQYNQLKRQGYTNLEVANGPNVTHYFHRKGHPITKEHYDKRIRKGKIVKQNVIPTKIYYKITN